MRKFLLAGIASLAFTAAAVARTSTTLEAGPQGPVTQVGAEGNNMALCTLQLHDATNTAKAPTYVGVYKYEDASVRFTFYTPFAQGQTWDHGGTVAFDIDGKVWRFDMQPSPNRLSLFIDYNSETPEAVDFLHALFNGQSMTVTAGQQVAVIPLTGSATGIAVLNQCRDTIVAQRTAPASPAPAAPAVPVPAFAPPAAPAMQPWGMVSASSGELKLYANGGTPTVITQIGTATVKFAVDSGAAAVALPPSAWNALLASGAVVAARDFVQNVTFTMADGHTHTKPIYRVSALTVGGVTAHDVLCDIAETEDSGLLGESFLGKFSSWTIDNAHGVLRLSM
jgi:hypothetical protein